MDDKYPPLGTFERVEALFLDTLDEWRNGHSVGKRAQMSRDFLAALKAWGRPVAAAHPVSPDEEEAS